MLLLGKGHHWHHWLCHYEWQHHSEEHTSWPIKIYYSSPKTKQLEPHTAQQRPEGEAWPWSQSSLKAALGHSLGVQEHRSSAQVTSQHTGTRSMLQHRAQAHPFLSQPLLPPQFTGLVFSFPSGQHHHKNGWSSSDEPFCGEEEHSGELQFLMAGVPNGQ